MHICIGCGSKKATGDEPYTKRCAQCKAAYYCSKECQVGHWKSGHKEVCEAAATVAALPPPPPPKSQLRLSDFKAMITSAPIFVGRNWNEEKRVRNTSGQRCL